VPVASPANSTRPWGAAKTSTGRQAGRQEGRHTDSQPPEQRCCGRRQKQHNACAWNARGRGRDRVLQPSRLTQCGSGDSTTGQRVSQRQDKYSHSLFILSVSWGGLRQHGLSILTCDVLGVAVCVVGVCTTCQGVVPPACDMCLYWGGQGGVVLAEGSAQHLQAQTAETRGCSAGGSQRSRPCAFAETSCGCSWCDLKNLQTTRLGNAAKQCRTAGSPARGWCTGNAPKTIHHWTKTVQVRCAVPALLLPQPARR
jgi:hypothetical protein